MAVKFLMSFFLEITRAWKSGEKNSRNPGLVNDDRI
jgi:hypothetical protein